MLQQQCNFKAIEDKAFRDCGLELPGTHACSLPRCRLYAAWQYAFVVIASGHCCTAGQWACTTGQPSTRWLVLLQERDGLSTAAEGATRLRIKKQELLKKEEALTSLVNSRRARLQAFLGMSDGAGERHDAMSSRSYALKWPTLLCMQSLLFRQGPANAIHQPQLARTEADLPMYHLEHSVDQLISSMPSPQSDAATRGQQVYFNLLGLFCCF